MPARSGDCTSDRNRVSRSVGSAVLTAAPAVARRALKVRSSICGVLLIGRWGRSEQGSAGRGRADGAAGAAPPVILCLIPFDEAFHGRRVALPVPMAPYRIG